MTLNTRHIFLRRPPKFYEPKGTKFLYEPETPKKYEHKIQKKEPKATNIQGT